MAQPGVADVLGDRLMAAEVPPAASGARAGFGHGRRGVAVRARGEGEPKVEHASTTLGGAGRFPVGVVFLDWTLRLAR